MLNFGHTIGHAIEAVAGYDGPFRHGEAVAIGMVAESRLAERLGWVHSDVVDRQVRLLERFGLPVTAPGLDLEKLIAGDEPRQEESPGQNPIRPAALDRQGGIDRSAGRRRRAGRPRDALSKQRRPCDASLRASDGSDTWPIQTADDRLLDLIHLTSVPGVGPQTCRVLLERFGSAGRRAFRDARPSFPR